MAVSSLVDTAMADLTADGAVAALDGDRDAMGLVADIVLALIGRRVEPQVDLQTVAKSDLTDC